MKTSWDRREVATKVLTEIKVGILLGRVSGIEAEIVQKRR
jgi:hypothetical protein